MTGGHTTSNMLEREESLRDRLTRVLGRPLVAELEAIAWRWPENQLLDEPRPITSPELIAWLWGKLILTACPVLKQLVLLSELFPQHSPERAALLELYGEIEKGCPMFGEDAPLFWEQVPTLSPVAEYWKMVAKSESSIDMATTLFSFCPWADEYAASHESIKEWMKIKLWSDAAWKRAKTISMNPPPEDRVRPPLGGTVIELPPGEPERNGPDVTHGCIDSTILAAEINRIHAESERKHSSDSEEGRF